MHYKIYASDEGFGHLVRQQAILDEMRSLCPDIQATLQTQHQVEAAKWIFDNIRIIQKFNNITWAKTSKGTPDLNKIRAYYTEYVSRSESFISNEEDLNGYDFLITDFVYEAFPVAVRDRIPAFGVGHFTWDWFFSKLYPLPIQTQVLERLQTYILSADVLYFPPFTPMDIINAYRNKITEVPLIVRKRDQTKNIVRSPDFNVLVVDSGSNVLSRTISRAMRDAVDMPGFHFFISENSEIQGDNITYIGKKELLLDYMPHMDLVIARGGFNTISECIAYRTPMLLIGEALNPEMEINMLYLKQEGLGSFVSLRRFMEHFRDTLSHFVDHEYPILKIAMENHEFRHDGARVVAEDILNRING